MKLHNIPVLIKATIRVEADHEGEWLILTMPDGVLHRVDRTARNAEIGATAIAAYRDTLTELLKQTGLGKIEIINP